jgi:hypothetical protein
MRGGTCRREVGNGRVHGMLGVDKRGGMSGRGAGHRRVGLMEERCTWRRMVHGRVGAHESLSQYLPNMVNRSSSSLIFSSIP